MEERIYKPLPKLNSAEARFMLNSEDLNDLMMVSLAAGMNLPDWKEAQDICVKLSHHEDEAVRANAALGLAYIAYTKGVLEKHIVKPVLLKLLRESDEYQWRVIDAIEDINLFVKWHIGEKALCRIQAAEE